MNQKICDLLVKDALISDSVEEILKRGENNVGVIDMLERDYLAKLEVIKQTNTKLKLFKQLFSKVICELKKQQSEED